MKTLQKNFTTPEQSKRLLELGVPADSADCVYPCYKQEGDSDKQIMYGHINIKHPAGSCPKYFIPCWSVGRPIEIYEICTGVLWQDTAQPSVKQPTLTERAIDTIVLFNKHGHMDFSKLEE